MNLAAEKEKIKKEIDLIDDPKVIRAIKELLTAHEADEDSPLRTFNEPPIEDWEMATPEGRTPTAAQLEEWLDKPHGKLMTGDEALAYILKKSEERKSKKKTG